MKEIELRVLVYRVYHVPAEIVAKHRAAHCAERDVERLDQD